MATQIPSPAEPLAGAAVAGKRWYQWFRDMEQTVARITPFSADSTIKVGAGQRFTTINAALEFLSRKAPFYKKGGIDVSIQLQAGFTMAEQVIVNGVDMSWVAITAADAEVAITASALTTTINDENQNGEDEDWKPAFAAIHGGRLPVLGALFAMGASSDNDKTGVFLLNNGYAHVLPDCGVKNAKGRGVHCKGSVFIGTEANFYNSKRHALYVESGSRVSAQSANLSRDPASTDDYGQVFVFTASIADLRYATCNDARGTDGAVFVRDASHAVLRNATINDSNSRGIWAHRGCFVDCRQATIEDAGTYAIFADFAAHVEGSEITISAPGSNAVRCEQGGEVVVSSGTIGGSDDTAALYAEEGARIIADAAVVTNDNVGCYAESGGFISAAEIDVSGCSIGLRVGAGGTIVANGADASGCTTNGALCNSGHLNITDANCQKGGSPDVTDIRVTNGGIIQANGSTGGTNVTANTVSSSGIIWQ